MLLQAAMAAEVLEWWLAHELQLHSACAALMIATGCVVWITELHVAGGVSAPYGRYASQGTASWFGPTVHPKAAWIFQECWSFLVPLGLLPFAQAACLASIPNRRPQKDACALARVRAHFYFLRVKRWIERDMLKGRWAGVGSGYGRGRDPGESSSWRLPRAHLKSLSPTPPPLSHFSLTGYCSVCTCRTTCIAPLCIHCGCAVGSGCLQVSVLSRPSSVRTMDTCRDDSGARSLSSS